MWKTCTICNQQFEIKDLYAKIIACPNCEEKHYLKFVPPYNNQNACMLPSHDYCSKPFQTSQVANTDIGWLILNKIETDVLEKEKEVERNSIHTYTIRAPKKYTPEEILTGECEEATIKDKLKAVWYLIYGKVKFVRVTWDYICSKTEEKE